MVLLEISSTSFYQNISGPTKKNHNSLRPDWITVSWQQQLYGFANEHLFWERIKLQHLGSFMILEWISFEIALPELRIYSGPNSSLWKQLKIFDLFTDFSGFLSFYFILSFMSSHPESLWAELSKLSDKQLLAQTMSYYLYDSGLSNQS